MPLKPLIGELTGHTVVDTLAKINVESGILTNAAKVEITPADGSAINVSSDTNERTLLKAIFDGRKGSTPVVKAEVKGNHADIVTYSSGDKLRGDELNFTVLDEIDLSKAKTLTSKTTTSLDGGSSTITFTIKDSASNVIDTGNNFASFLDTGRPVVLTDTVLDVATAKKVLAKSPSSLKYTKIARCATIPPI